MKTLSSVRMRRPWRLVVAGGVMLFGLAAGCTAEELDSGEVGEAPSELTSWPDGGTCEEDIDPRDYGDELDEPDDETDPNSFPNVNNLRFEGCGPTRTANFELAADALLANWSAFENNLTAAGVNLPVDCLKRRLSTNGRLRCAVSPGDHCPTTPDLRAGWTVPHSTRSRACTAWLGDMEAHNTTANARTVCQGTLMMHEFAHGCISTEARAELVDNAARITLNAILGESLTEQTDCRLD